MHKFNNVIFGQKAFVLRDGKVLIIKRKDVDIFSGMWDVPGGKVESEDTLSGALAREIKEETGLDLTKVLLILSSSKFTGSLGDHPTIFRNIYLCSAEGEVRLSSEHSEYLWVMPENLTDYKFPDDPDFQNALKQLSTFIKTLSPEKKYSDIF